ncbi:hypothetical protein [uncultured Shewanella sp.]|uniref:hypothetical protein n=1 Tax=uncultured Shewanella sp. TaxID=173975 RepID=UPI002624C599|nr:hypothetical protein [uncultured Shewanella sp.]
MAKVNLSQASKLVGKNRTTIWRHIKAGKLSCEKDRGGNPVIDTSELLRVYGEIIENATPKKDKMQHQATPSYDELIKVIDQLRAEQVEMKEQLKSLTNRLEHKPIEAVTSAPITEPVKGRPEDDPEWPKEVKTTADITLRKRIRDKYR